MNSDSANPWTETY